jgi:hypothetical protein
MGEPGLEHQGRQATSRARPGSVIFFGAVAAAYGATVVVAALLTYAMLAGPGAAPESSELAGFRTPQGELSLWVRFVLATFLTVSGLGLIRTHRWARSMFIALALVRAGILGVSGLIRHDPAVSAAGLILGLVPDVLLFGVGCWFLTRPHISRHFEPAPLDEGRG